MDLLSPLLQHLDLETRLFHREDHCGRWTIAGPFERKAMFHLVARGRCLLRSALRPDGQALTAGDVALFLRPATHEVVPHPEATASEETTLLCGYLEFGSGLAELLLAGLPEELVLSASHSLTRGASGVLALMLDEAAGDRPGSSALVSRLADALFVHVLRQQLHAAPTQGLLGALVDPQLGPALVAMHTEPAASFTLPALAKRAGLSRAAFARRFTDAVQLSPMAYLTQLRLEQARSALVHRGVSVGEAAAVSGYATEAAFGRAFRRVFGQSPGAVRRKPPTAESLTPRSRRASRDP